MKTRNILGAALIVLALGACGPDLEAANTVGELETQDPATQPEVLFHGADVEDPAVEALNLPQIDQGMMNPTLLRRDALRQPAQAPDLRIDVEQVQLPQ